MANGQFSLASGAITFNGSTTNFSGQVTITGGSGIQNLTDAGDLASLDSVAYNSSYITGTKPPSDADRTITAINGGLISTGRIELGTTGTVNAGIDGAGTAGTSIRFWAGNTYANRASAPFRVDQSGNLTATSATITGSITMTGGSISWASITAPSYSQITGTKPPTDAINAATATTITQNTVTTAYVNALSVTAGSVSANNITAGTITGSNIRTGTSGKRVDIGVYTSGEINLFGTTSGQSYISQTTTYMTLFATTNIYLNPSTRVDVAGGVAPVSGDSYSLGYGGVYWLNGYIKTIYAKNIYSSDTADVVFQNNITCLPTYNRTVTSARAVQVNSSGQFGYVSSPLRHKRDIEYYDFDFDALLNLRVVSFKYIDEIDASGAVNHGVIADEAQALGLHEFVQCNADGLPDYFAYEKLPVALLQLCQDLARRLKTLEEKMEG
jgi:hypothetical protein